MEYGNSIAEQREQFGNRSMNQVDFINGKTRLFGIVGDPIEQVRSPEMVSWEFQQRHYNAVLIPIHITQNDFNDVIPDIMRIHNLDGLIFTIPFKVKAIKFAKTLGPQASLVQAINAIKRQSNGDWRGEIFDGVGCVEAFKRRGIALTDKRWLSHMRGCCSRTTQSDETVRFKRTKH